MENQPGTYQVQFDEGVPFITHADEPLENRDFVARGSGLSIFTFNIVDSDVLFAQTPTNWGITCGETPDGIEATVDSERKQLVINVVPGTLSEDAQFPFSIHFNNAAVIGDPTIVEKPPEGLVG